jgi:hypothetical protein
LTEKPAQLEYRLLTEFRRLFEGKLYKHRASNQGDFVAMHLYEDLVTINGSVKLIDAAINRKDRVLNVENKRRGVTPGVVMEPLGRLFPAKIPSLIPDIWLHEGLSRRLRLALRSKSSPRR